MHELSLMMEVIRIVEDMAVKNDLKHINSIVFEIGEVSTVIPRYIDEYFPMVIDDKPIFKDTKLKFITIEARAVCNDCGKAFAVVKNEGHCPNCDSKDYTLFSGTEFCIREVVVDDPAG